MVVILLLIIVLALTWPFIVAALFVVFGALMCALTWICTFIAQLLSVKPPQI